MDAITCQRATASWSRYEANAGASSITRRSIRNRSVTSGSSTASGRRDDLIDNAVREVGGERLVAEGLLPDQRRTEFGEEINVGLRREVPAIDGILDDLAQMDLLVADDAAVELCAEFWLAEALD